ncbi:hypothetical protein LOK49_LG14G01387 [Camellia lanceoleosa]|uniref:Uncharacterized protein n=1 Tax=Camellia lanceoleosa TaxID=1840588 RepID=A0ACC0FC07_9ERIC|nr:hypothetical protein LOK49_LG14G01387 [Camellia lanceoleosa]
MNNQFEEPDQPVVVEAEELVPAAKITSGTGSGFEILCQGFNWESHKSGRWYMELREKVAELSSLGFTVGSGFLQWDVIFQENWQLTVGCNLPGKWVLHWGVNYVNDIGSEWDQPPVGMRPPDSIPIKDYAIETPLKKSSAVVEGDLYYEVKINFSTNRDIAAINFDEETGAWYQHKGRDFKVVLIDNLHEDGNFVGAKKGLGTWPGALGQLSSMLLKSEGAHPKGEDISEIRYPNQKDKSLEGFYEEHSIVREVLISNSRIAYVRNVLRWPRIFSDMERDLQICYLALYKNGFNMIKSPYKSA